MFGTTKKYVFLIAFFLMANLQTFAQFGSNAGKIWFDDNFLYVNLINRGVLVIDNFNPKNPKKLGIIEIEGNVDMAVRGKLMYANSHEDLLTIDITDLKNAKILNRNEKVFSQRRGFNSNPTASIGWKTGDEMAAIMNSFNIFGGGTGTALGTLGIINNMIGGGGIGTNGITNTMVTSVATATGQSSGGSSSGKGGSMACFTMTENHLYAIDSRDIHVFNLTDPKKPAKTANPTTVSLDIETIFAHENKLFLGSQAGMYIYDIKDRQNPQRMGVYRHTRSCDPVVVEGNYAYVTMRNGTDCAGDVNQLDVVDVSNPFNPQKVATHKMTNPHGLGIDQGVLFICDGKDGLKVFDAADPQTIGKNKLAQFSDINAFDVIPDNKRKVLMMVGSNKIKQYDYSDRKNLKLLSEISTNDAN
ncbi:MAG: hypothetical protein EAZ97_05850 [Bacteroidetes bacterium]|nr:MAG: hypothetical protein EAZ97_05850 [Bacteroidota bacterium]